MLDRLTWHDKVASASFGKLQQTSSTLLSPELGSFRMNSRFTELVDTYEFVHAEAANCHDFHSDGTPCAISDAPVPIIPELWITGYSSFIRSFIQHLECAIHTIIYERDIYPQELFITMRKYDYPVKMCRVPQVSQYVRQIAGIVGNQLLEGYLQIVSIVIVSEQYQPLERFNFDFSSFPAILEEQIYPNLMHETGGGSGISLGELNEQFRAMITQLSVCSSRLGPLPENCTFTLMAEMAANRGQPKDNQNTRNWMASNLQINSANSGNNTSFVKGDVDDVIGDDNDDCVRDHDTWEGVKLVPLRSVVDGALNMEVWIEESNIKTKLCV
ncbi:DNA-binding protein [Trichophaea hybrida]|nr:DNA-binding protein [Trichophaea hybrida]